jgi:hypothetical protein
MHVMNRFVMRACAVAAAGIALGTWAVTAASAAGGSATSHHRATGPAGLVAGRGAAPRPASNDRAARLSATPANNRYFAGYVAGVPTGSATTSEASFALPTLTCTTTDQAITPVAGVDVNSNKTFSAAFVFTGCVNGTATYFPSVVVNGTETDYSTSPFAAGDVIDLTTKVSTFRTRVQVTDVTTGVTQKITTGPGASADGAYVGDSSWSTGNGLLHVPAFGKLQFKNCLFDGKAIAGWHPFAYQRVNSTGTVQISTGALWTTEPAFTTRYMHS